MGDIVLANVLDFADTGLNPPILRKNGYITWTILTYLVEQGRVVKGGHSYRLAGD